MISEKLLITDFDPKTEMRQPNPETASNKNQLLKKKTSIAIQNFYHLPLTENGHKHEDNEISGVERRVWENIQRINTISETLSSEKFQHLKERKEKLRGKTELGAVWCVDGRLDGMAMGVLVDIWEVPLGSIKVKKTSDGRLIPDSPELRGHIKNDAIEDRELLEVVFAHYDSTDPRHGCAANAAILGVIKDNMSPANQGELTFDDFSKINHTQRAEDANLIILRKTSVPAFTQYYNKVRETVGKDGLPTIAIGALYDTATMGVTLREDGHDDLAATNLTNKYKETIATQLDITYGEFNQNFTDANLLLDFAEKKVDIMEFLLTNEASKDFYNEISTHIENVYPDLTDGQTQALRFLIAESVAFQYLTGLSEIPAGGPNHPFSSHSEGYMGISIRGEYIGKFDTKQAFGSTAADAADAIEQIKIEYGVMDKVGVDMERPRIVYISNSISGEAFKKDKKARKRASSNNDSITHEIIYDPKIREWITENRLTIINVLTDDTTGEVLDVLDLSSSY